LNQALVAVVVLLAGSGCHSSTALPIDGPIKPTAQLQPANIKLTAADGKGLDGLIATHKGQVVFVDYWATWCQPCVEYFPHTVEVSRKYKDRGLATMAVAFDDQSEAETVRTFLAKQGAGFENLISSYDPGPAAFEGFDINLVPHFRLYDRQGKLRFKWDNKPEDVDQRIEELLAEKAE
jgi:thiol-disulfide isomerase/thioredoxin